MEIQEKVNALLEKEEFAKALEKVQNAQEVVDLFAAEGIEVPLNLAEELFEPLLPDGELDEKALDEVAGGGLGTCVGTAIGNGIAYGAGYLGGRLAGWSKKKSKEYAKSCSKFGGALGGIIGTVVAG